MKSAQELSDKELLELMAQDDQHAFNTLYTRYWKKVLSLATQKIGDLMEGENIVQDIFVSLWNRRQTLQITTGLENYLVVSVKYRVIKTLNKQRNQRLFEERNGITVDLLDDSTQEYLSFEELRKRLEVLVGQLPEKNRLIYKMNKEEGMSYKAIAEELNITEKSVDGHLSRANRTLRAGLNTFLTTFLL